RRRRSRWRRCSAPCSARTQGPERSVSSGSPTKTDPSGAALTLGIALAPSAMTARRRQTVFACLDPPRVWPPTRARPHPDRLERELDALPGVGVTLKRKLARLGLHTIRDLLEHRPRRYESAVEEVAIAALGGGEEVAISGEVLNVSARRRGRLEIVTARISDGPAAVAATWFNQPWLEEQLRPGTHVRLRGKPGRY